MRSLLRGQKSDNGENQTATILSALGMAQMMIMMTQMMIMIFCQEMFCVCIMVTKLVLMVLHILNNVDYLAKTTVGAAAIHFDLFASRPTGSCFLSTQ